MPAHSYLNAVIVLTFAVVYAVLAAFLALLGAIHGPEAFPYAVLGCLVVAEGVLWWWYFFLRRHDYQVKTWMLLAGALALGVAMTATAKSSWGPLVNLEVARQERLAVATEVVGVRDEVLLSPRGNPIGIRVKYSARFPNRDYFWQSALLQGDSRLPVGVWADGRRVAEVIEPPMTTDRNGVRRYEKGKTYDFTTEFLPNFLIWNADKSRLCILDPPPEYAAAFRDLMANGPPVRYTVTIPGTKYHVPTKQAYDLKSFYQGVEKEGPAHLQGIGFGGATSSCK